MSQGFFYLALLALILLGISFVYTWNVGREQRLAKNENDSEIPKRVQERPYLSNPVLLSYLLFAVFLLLIIIFYMFRSQSA